MKIVVFGPEKRTGALHDGAIVDLSFAFAKYLRERNGVRHAITMAAALVPPDLARFIEGGPQVLEDTHKALDYLFGAQAQNQSGPRGEKIVYQPNEVRIHAPKPAGARVACAGGNFADHQMAMAAKFGDAGNITPGDAAASLRKRGMWGFWKVEREAAPPDGNVIYPAVTKRLDYEGELAIVLGKAGKDIKPTDARQYIWGVTLFFDWSIRDMHEPDAPLKFAMQKNFDTCHSIGPCIVVGEVDPFNSEVETILNGERRQHFNTRDMVFSFGDFMEFLSRDFTLYPGDIISGGTAAGTAADSSPLLPDRTFPPDRFLKPGDTVEVRSSGIGSLRAHIVAKSA